MSNSREEETYSTIFTSLKHPIRRKILRMLYEKPKSFSEMQETFRIESSHLTYHLENLKELIYKTDDGRYKLSTFGEAAVTTMSKVEEAPRNPSLSIKWKSILVVLTIGLVLLSSVSCIQYLSLNKASAEFEQLSIDSQQLEELSKRAMDACIHDIEILNITTDTTLTKDHFGEIVILADGVTLDGDGHMVIGPGPDIDIWDGVYCNICMMVHGRSSRGILLEGRTGVTVKNCRVTGHHWSFLLRDSDGNTLQGNTANNYGYAAFVLSSSSNNILLNNTVNGNGVGVYTQNGFLLYGSDGGSDGNTLQGNTANGNWRGFMLEESDGNTLQGNTANGNWIGFMLEESDGNILRGNTAKDNARSGFEVEDSSNYTFFHNNLIDNPYQAHVARAYANTWDNGYPSGGNYWSDYKGVDANGDGIGDTPYVIDEDNTDRFPLMAPFGVFDDGT